MSSRVGPRNDHLKRWLGALAVIITTVLASLAHGRFEVPVLTGPVVDEAKILNRRTETRLSQALRALYERGGTQITVLTVPSLEGLAIEQASIQVVDQWKLGNERIQDGVLLMIASQERKVRIEVGRGREGVLTDADSKRIIDESIRPLFRAGDFDSGVLVGVYRIVSLTDPDFNIEPYLEGAGGRRLSPEGNPVRFWVLVALTIFFMLFGRGRHRGLIPAGMILGGYRGYGYRGGGFGGGGGGWRGGGGGFAGGGASGDW